MISSGSSGVVVVVVAVAEDNKEDRGGFISEINIVLLFSGTALPLLCATLPILSLCLCWGLALCVGLSSLRFWRFQQYIGTVLAKDN